MILYFADKSSSSPFSHLDECWRLRVKNQGKSALKYLTSLFLGLPCRAGKERENHAPYLTGCHEAASLSVVDSNSYSNSLSVGSMRESGGQVSSALEAPDDIWLSVTDH